MGDTAIQGIIPVGGAGSGHRSARSGDINVHTPQSLTTPAYGSARCNGKDGGGDARMELGIPVTLLGILRDIPVRKSCCEPYL